MTITMLLYNTVAAASEQTDVSVDLPRSGLGGSGLGESES
jgi:hypothetical protein